MLALVSPIIVTLTVYCMHLYMLIKSNNFSQWIFHGIKCFHTLETHFSFHSINFIVIFSPYLWFALQFYCILWNDANCKNEWKILKCVGFYNFFHCIKFIHRSFVMPNPKIRKMSRIKHWFLCPSSGFISIFYILSRLCP